ncbi:hypothetical protein LXL04_015138 [Taraxacum kok-saghyz]
MKAQRQISDRISALPQETIGKILSLMPIRYALGRAYCQGNGAIFHVLLLHRGPILEFSLSVSREICSEIDHIMLHLSRSNDIKKFIFKNFMWETPIYALPCSFFSLQGLEHLDLSYCRFESSSMYKGFSKLKSLRFSYVFITNQMVLGFLANCPLLVEFTWNNVDIELTEGVLVELFMCLPSVQVLEISNLHIKHSSVLCVISSSPNLEKIKLEMCVVHGRLCSQQTFEKLHDLQDYTGLKLDHLKELKITRFKDCGSWMRFVNIVMARWSPMLKKVQIELRTFDSVAKEVKMVRNLLGMQFDRASPTAKLILKSQKISLRKTNEVVMML